MSNATHTLFQNITHGVYVVGAAHAGRRNAFTAAWVMQTSFDPPMLALSISPAHSSYELIKQSAAFTLNVLAHGQLELARHFGQSARVDKLSGVPWRASHCGAPILEDAPAWFECRLAGECEAGDHMIVLGRVTDGSIVDPNAKLMNYRDTGDMDGSGALYPPSLKP